MAVAFARVLRGAGLRVPLGSVLTFVDALGAFGSTIATRSTGRDGPPWCAHPEDIPLFDRSFDVFWLAATAAPRTEHEEPLHITLAIDDDSDEGDDDPGAAEASDDPQITLRFSAMEVLRHKDFANYTDDELRTAQQLMTRLRFIGPPRRSFRQHRSRRGRRPDLQATMRSALRTGGEPIRRQLEGARREAPPARAARRRQRLDGALRPRPAPVRARRRVGPPAGGGVRHRHPTHPRDPRAEQPRPRQGPHPGRQPRARLERRHPAGRLPAPVQRPVGRARHGTRRDRGGALRRLGPWRPRGAGRRDGAAATRRLPRRSG